MERRELAGDPRPIPVVKGSVETTASATGIDTDVARLFDAYAAKLLRYCACRVGPDAAEDLVASTFLVAVSRRDAYDPTRGSELAWLYGIEVRVARDVVMTLAGPYAEPDAEAVRQVRSRLDRRVERARPAGPGCGAWPCPRPPPRRWRPWRWPVLPWCPGRRHRRRLHHRRLRHQPCPHPSRSTPPISTSRRCGTPTRSRSCSTRSGATCTSASISPALRARPFRAPGRIRTCGQLLRRQPLYPLSYGRWDVVVAAHVGGEPHAERSRCTSGRIRQPFGAPPVSTATAPAAKLTIPVVRAVIPVVGGAIPGGQRADRGRLGRGRPREQTGRHSCLDVTGREIGCLTNRTLHAGGFPDARAPATFSVCR